MLRRANTACALPLAACCLLLWTALAAAASADERHGLSAFGDLKYPPDFKHFDYVNPNAPRSGRLSHIGPGATVTFDSFNDFILAGDRAQGLFLMFDSLMVRALDEPDGVYGLVARSAELAPDRRALTFRLRPEAKFSDGSALSAEDVVFSFGVLKEKGHPQFRFGLRDVVKAEALDDATVRYTFEGNLLRDLPLTVATLPVLSKSYYAKQKFEETTLDPPLGSGPYKIGSFKQGTFVAFKRRQDYWAKDLPVNRGRYNFDEVRYEYFRDTTAGFEAFKGGAFDLREEFTSKDWATGYDIPQVRDGRIVRLVLPDETPSATQGWFLNTRRPKFSDARVRKALVYAFDFEWSNKNLFYGLYARTHSYFENSDLKATGRPSSEELVLLEPYRAKLLPEVFGEPYAPPVSDGSGTDRRLLRQAVQLLNEAGWELKNGKRVNKAGEVLEVEFLDDDPVFERILGPYLKNLQALGVQATIRMVDPAQYERRVKAFDFDIVTARPVMRLTPGVELRTYFGSESTATQGSFNYAGIKDPVVDALMDKMLEARSRPELLAATRALDRVLRAGHYWVPHWYRAAQNLAFWDRFGRPAVKPKYGDGILDTWWYDPEKAAKLMVK